MMVDQPLLRSQALKGLHAPVVSRVALHKGKGTPSAGPPRAIHALILNNTNNSFTGKLREPSYDHSFGWRMLLSKDDS